MTRIQTQYIRKHTYTNKVVHKDLLTKIMVLLKFLRIVKLSRIFEPCIPLTKLANSISLKSYLCSRHAIQIIHRIKIHKKKNRNLKEFRIKTF